jgi:hypothetical protein
MQMLHRPSQCEISFDTPFSLILMIAQNIEKYSHLKLAFAIGTRWPQQF